jgi:hypothetical protein
MEKIGFKPMRRVYLNRFTVYCLRSLSHFSSDINWRKTSGQSEGLSKKEGRDFPITSTPLPSPWPEIEFGMRSATRLLLI